MKLFVLGIPCAGKTTLVKHLRKAHGLNAVDMDHEILRFNGGVWPDIETKNNVVQPKVLEAVCAMDEVILFNSYMSVERTRRLRAAGFGILLLDVSEAEIRRRDAIRFEQEGWTNIEWLNWHQSVVQELQDHNLFDGVICGERDVASVARDIVRFGERLSRWEITSPGRFSSP